MSLKIGQTVNIPRPKRFTSNPATNPMANSFLRPDAIAVLAAEVLNSELARRGVLFTTTDWGLEDRGEKYAVWYDLPRDIGDSLLISATEVQDRYLAPACEEIADAVSARVGADAIVVRGVRLSPRVGLESSVVHQKSNGLCIAVESAYDALHAGRKFWIRMAYRVERFKPVPMPEYPKTIFDAAFMKNVDEMYRKGRLSKPLNFDWYLDGVPTP